MKNVVVDLPQQRSDEASSTNARVPGMIDVCCKAPVPTRMRSVPRYSCQATATCCWCHWVQRQSK